MICAARDTTTGDPVAIKFEKADPNRQILRMEVSALKKLQAGLVGKGFTLMIIRLPTRLQAHFLGSCEWMELHGDGLAR